MRRVCVYIILCRCVYVYTSGVSFKIKALVCTLYTLVICVKCDRVAVREREREEVMAKYLQKIAMQKVL